MNLIAQLLPADNVVVGGEASSKKRLFEQAGQLFEDHQGLDHGIVFDSLFARERLGSTGLGQGIAIPHGRIKGLKDAVAAFIRLAAPLPFDAPDGNPVQMLFILLVPEQATDLHLQILGELAHMFSDPNLRARLMACHDADEVYRLITGWTPHDTNHRSAAV